MNYFFSFLGILWYPAEVKVSELKASSIGETYSIGNEEVSSAVTKMTVDVNINISNTVVKAAKSDKLNKGLFVFFPNSTKDGCYQ